MTRAPSESGKPFSRERRRWPVILFAVGLIACSGGDPGPEPSASLDHPIMLERVRTIVRQDTTAETAWLGRIFEAQFDSIRRHFLALDRDDQRIVEFTTAGEFVGYYGRRGEGPGETTNVSAFAAGTDHLTSLDVGNGKLMVFDRSTREMQLEIKLDRRVRDVTAIGDTLVAVIPGEGGSLFEVFRIDGRSLGSFGSDGYLPPGRRHGPIMHAKDALLVLKPDIPEGRIYRLDGTLHAEITFAEVASVLAEWREEFARLLRRANLVGPDGAPVMGGKNYVAPAGTAGNGSFLLSATPENLDVNPWELWQLDERGRVRQRYVFEDVWVRAFAASFPSIYALGIGEEFGVYEYRIPQPADPR